RSGTYTNHVCRTRSPGRSPVCSSTHSDFDRARHGLLNLPSRNPRVDRARFELRVLRHDAERTDLTPLAGLDADADHAADAARHAASEADAPGLHDAALDGVAREVHVLADNHAIVEVQHVVIRDRQAVDVYAA